jgi:hypothetical protein
MKDRSLRREGWWEMFYVKIDSKIGMRLYHAAREKGISGTLLINELIKGGLDRLQEQHEEPNQTSNFCATSDHTYSIEHKTP